MKNFLTIAAGLIAGGVLAFAAAPAMAHVDVGVNIGVPGVYAPPPVVVQPRPVYVEPRPVYVEPRPVVVQPRPVYVEPRPVYVERPWRGQEWREHEWRERHWRGHGGWDRDGDGVPNRYDHHPNNPYRR